MGDGWLKGGCDGCARVCEWVGGMRLGIGRGPSMMAMEGY